jgi:putative ABC transport system permease protein
MNFAKRAFLSLSRRVGKTTILFLVILILGNLIAATVAMRQAIDQSEALAKITLGANVSLGLDDQKLMAAWNAGEEPEIKGLKAELIEELGKFPQVKSYDYTLDVYLISKTLRGYEPPSSDSGGGGGVVMRADGSSSDINSGMIIRGVHYAPIQAIEEGKLELVEGRVFTQQEIEQGTLVGLVSDKVAELNNIHLGDTVVLTNEIRDWSGNATATVVVNGEETEATVPVEADAGENGVLVDSHDVVIEVIGIFTLVSGNTEAAPNDGKGAFNQDEWMAQMMESDTYNSIYAPIGVSQAEELFMMEGYNKVHQDEEGYEPAAYEPWYTPIYVLNSVDDLASFEEAAEAALPEYYTVLSADSQFEQIAGPMKSIQRIVTITLIASVIAALVIVSLVVVLFLRDRRKEFGIYLSLGVRKPAIIGQVLIEVLVVALVALGIALVTGNLISGGLSQELVENQLIAAQQDPYGSVSISYTGGTAGMMMGNLSLDDIIDNYKVGISLPYILTFLGLGVGVTVLSCIVPLLYVLRLKPKKILM